MSCYKSIIVILFAIFVAFVLRATFITKPPKSGFLFLISVIFMLQFVFLTNAVTCDTFSLSL